VNISFNPTSYRALIEKALSTKFTILPMQDAITSKSDPVLLLRHDIDFSLEYAVQMAELENELGISSTYFVIPENEFYDPFSDIGKEQIQHMQNLGHEIGLHYDTSKYNPEEYEKDFTKDMQMLSDLIGEQVSSAAQHDPTNSLHLNIENLITNEAYSEKIRSQFAYVSDSSMQWREKTPLDLIEEGKSFQFLSHPIWWFANGETQADKISAIANISPEKCTKAIDNLNRALEKRAELDNKFKKEHG
jgi:hypothetical protein